MGRAAPPSHTDPLHAPDLVSVELGGAGLLDNEVGSAVTWRITL